MLKKILLLILIIYLATPFTNAQELSVTFPKTITLVNTPISVDLYLYNTTSTTNTYSLKSYTAPYPSEFLEERITISPNSTKKITLKITQLSNQLQSTYNSSIEISSATYYNKINFEIIQKANRVCPIDLQSTVIYVKESDNYKLELTFKNSTNRDQDIDIIALKDINLEYPLGKLTAPKNSESSIVRVFKTKLKETKLEYRCNSVYGTVDIELPKKEKPQEEKSIFTGLFSFGAINLVTVFNDIVFQIILIFILIILVLSFTTRYIKYVFKK